MTDRSRVADFRYLFRLGDGAAVGFLQSTISVRERIAWFAHVLTPGAWGQGYATESLRWLLAYLESTGIVDVARAQIDHRNVASQAVSQSRLRSPTAEAIFAEWPGVLCISAGTSRDADILLSHELVEWAALIFCMEKQHQRKLHLGFQWQMKDVRVICRGIPDDYQFMQPELVT